MTKKVPLPTRVVRQAKMKVELLAEPASGDSEIQTLGRHLLLGMLPTSKNSGEELEPSGRLEEAPSGPYETPDDYDLRFPPDETDVPPKYLGRTISEQPYSKRIKNLGCVTAAAVVGLAVWHGLTVEDDKSPAPTPQNEPVMIYPTQQYAPLSETGPAPVSAGPTEYQSLLPTSR